MKSCLSFLLSLSLFTSTTFAQDLTTTNRRVDTSLNSGSVFYSGNYPGAVLMRVNMLGEVQRPGVHHMPVDTDFNTALGFAGGPTRFAKVDDAVIKRRGVDGKEQVIKVDLDQQFRELHHDLQLKPNDTLYIPQSRSVISDNTFRVIMVTSFLAGIVLSAVSIHQLTKDK